MKKSEVVAILRRNLQSVMAERKVAIVNPDAAAARTALRQFQAARLANTHADLLAADETRAAAQFFLEDLYGNKDFTQRDADIARVIPMMERFLPVTALQCIAEAIELDALSETLDAAMASCLGQHFTQQDYVTAYRSVGCRSDREKQIDLVNSVGHSLCELLHIPMIGTTLAAMRKPAKLVRVSVLHQFLERGYTAFKQIKIPLDFVAAIVTRETAILENLYTEQADPFNLSPQ